MALIDLLKILKDDIKLLITYEGNSSLYKDIEEIPLNWLYKNVTLTRPFENIQMIWIE